MIEIILICIIGMLLLVLISFSSFLIIRQLKRINIYNKFKINTIIGIDKEEVVEIGGIKQYIYIRGENKNNPVILVIHGGPGSPLTPLLYKYQIPLEKDYTVVNWDQRNSGKTFFLNDYKKVINTLTIDRMIEDLKELVIYIRNELSQEKIIILGHSWGTALGSAFVQTYPEYVEAFISVSQLVNTNTGGKFALTKAIEVAKSKNNLDDVNILENLSGYNLSDSNFNIKAFLKSRALVSKYLSKGYNHQPVLEILFSPYYSLKESSFFSKNTLEIQGPLLNYLSKDYDVKLLGTDYQVPVFYILGDHDWITPYALAQNFFDTINAPIKECALIENAGHLLMLDNPNQFCNEILRMLSYK